MWKPSLAHKPTWHKIWWKWCSINWWYSKISFWFALSSQRFIKVLKKSKTIIIYQRIRRKIHVKTPTRIQSTCRISNWTNIRSDVNSIQWSKRTHEWNRMVIEMFARAGFSKSGDGVWLGLPNGVWTILRKLFGSVILKFSEPVAH